MSSNSSKIRILHTIRQGKIGGGETHVLDLVSNLPADEFESEVLAFTDGEMVNALNKLGVKCHVIHTEKPFDFRVWPAVKKLVDEGGFDLIHAHGTRACSNSFRAARKNNIPLLYTIHGWSFHQDQPYFVRQARELSEKYLVHRTTTNISVSQSNHRDGVERIQMPNSVVINYGVNLNKFNPDAEYDLKRHDLSLPKDKVLVGMLARLTIQKDPLTFIRAVQHVIEKVENVHFLLVGGGELEDQCIAEAKQAGIEKHITFEAFRTDVPAVLKLMDIYCLPSLWEGLPIGILEAMAMRKAIVATPVDGTKEVIRHGETGMLFDEYNHSQMAENIVGLVEDADKRKKLGANARSVIENSFGVKRMAEDVGSLYQKVLNKNLVGI